MIIYLMQVTGTVYSEAVPEAASKSTKTRALAEEKAVTLIAGMRCSDGVLIGADTEHTDGIIRFHEHKLVIYPSKKKMSCHISPLAHEPFRIVFSGAGDSDYIKMTVDAALTQIKTSGHTMDDMVNAVQDAVEDTHEKIFKHWDVHDPNRPAVALFVGLRDGEETKVLRTSDVSVS